MKFFLRNLTSIFFLGFFLGCIRWFVFIVVVVVVVVIFLLLLFLR